MKVHPSHTDDLVPAAQAQRPAHTAKATAPRGGTSFAALHASAVAATSTRATKAAGVPGTDVATPQPTTVTGTVVKAIKLDKGEAMTAVAGHAYGEITAGKRDGMFVNTSQNARRGQAFVRVEKHGVEYHIYGTGKDRLVVALKKRPADPAVQAPSGGIKAPTVSGTGATGAPTL
jgi:hypothetical protein